MGFVLFQAFQCIHRRWVQPQKIVGIRSLPIKKALSAPRLFIVAKGLKISLVGVKNSARRFIVIIRIEALIGEKRFPLL